MIDFGKLHPHSPWRALNGTYPAQCVWNEDHAAQRAARLSSVQRVIKNTGDETGKITYHKKHNSFVLFDGQTKKLDSNKL